jgi:hypothetical protein
MYFTRCIGGAEGLFKINFLENEENCFTFLEVNFLAIYEDASDSYGD